MGSEVTKYHGYASRGGEVPAFHPNEIVIVGIDEEENEHNRYAFCPRVDEPIEEEFLASIRDDGVRDPVSVARDGNRVILLAGRRRVRAARLIWQEQAKAGMKVASRITVRVIIRKGQPADLFRINVEENAQRKDLTAPQRAQLMLHAMRMHGDDKAKVATLFRCSSRTVENTLAILDCSPKVQKAIAAGMPATVAREFAGMSRAEQEAKLDEMTEKGATRGESAKRALVAAKQGKPVGNPVGRMRSRQFTERWLAEIEESKIITTEFKIAKAILRFLMGDDGAIDGGLQQIAFDAMKDRRKKDAEE
jgi:ParB family chromosome partitioning protein